MIRIFNMYQLNSGVNFEDYKRWSCEIDQKVVNSKKGCYKFEVFQIEEIKEGKPLVKIVEVIDVESLERWEEIRVDEDMKQIGEKLWGEFAHRDSRVVMSGCKIE